MFNSDTSCIVIKTINVISFPFPVFWLILMDNQNAKLKLKLYVKLLTKFSNMPVKWPFKILLGGDGSVLQHGINGFLQKKNKAFNEFLIFCLITANFQTSRQNHTLFWQKNPREKLRGSGNDLKKYLHLVLSI